MHAAQLATSPRLQSVHSLLLDGQEHSTRDIIRRTGACAINSVISELRENGIRIDCRYVGETEQGNSEYGYKLSTPAPRGSHDEGGLAPAQKQGGDVVPQAPGAGLVPWERLTWLGKAERIEEIASHYSESRAKDRLLEQAAGYRERAKA